MTSRTERPGIVSDLSGPSRREAAGKGRAFCRRNEADVRPSKMTQGAAGNFFQ
jgi:hypothetical protein